MQITRSSIETTKGRADWFTGDVYVDAVAGADLLDRATFALAAADAYGDEDRLAVRVGVPGGAGARGEVHGGGGERRRSGRCGARLRPL